MDDLQKLTDRCLGAFVAAGTLDISLDRVAAGAGTTKRMLVHYFGSREELEVQVMECLEERLRAQFRPERFAPGATLAEVVEVLWEQTTAPQTRGVLLLIMDVSRRGWSGSVRAKAFYVEQQRLWLEMLERFLPDAGAVEELLQMFQGAVLVYLVTGDRAAGRRGLGRLAERLQ